MERIQILLVDDEEQFLDAVTLLFEDYYQVRRARDGREALELIAASPSPPQVILSDQRMPQMTGLELFSELKRRDLGHLGRILFTAYGEMDLVVDAFNRGLIHNYIAKPITREKVSLLREYIDRAAEQTLAHLEEQRCLQPLLAAMRQSGNTPQAGWLQERVLTLMQDSLQEVERRGQQLQQWQQQCQQRLQQQGSLSQDELSRMGQVLADHQAALHRMNDWLTSWRRIAAHHDSSAFVAIERKGNGRYSLHDILLSALSSVGPMVSAKGIQIATRLTAHDGYCACIPSDLYYVFNAVLQRAAQSAADGGEILIRSEEKGDQLLFTFWDNGLEKSGAASATSSENAGFSLCQQILEKYAGRLAVSPSAPRGTVVAVSLPRQE